ncbi:hypothetical protein [Photobacterium sp. J15]|uniref:hypothetical protein n=1 Tax=Photobacterium sp. J15 TaxID=265901 RepID=UPI0007E36FB6|nr:hypothetical protein [Photobacterium sp. J15]
MKFVFAKFISFILTFHAASSFASELSQKESHTLEEWKKISKPYNDEAVGFWDCNHLSQVQEQAIIQVKKDQKGIVLHLNNKTIRYKQNNIQYSNKTISAYNNRNVDHITFDSTLKLLSYQSMPEVDINKYDHYLCSRRK